MFTSEDTYVVSHEVPPGSSGVRLDAFLKGRYRKRSRGAIQRAIEAGAIILERHQGPHVSVGRLKASSQLIPGDRVLVVSERKPEPEVDFGYKVLHEDDVLFVIDKPANLPVHPAGRYFFNTLLVHLRTRGHREPLEVGHEYFLVHRIDKETSGILVLAKERAACTALTRQFAERSTRKRYLAVVRGVTPEAFESRLAMRRARNSRIELKMEVAPEEDGGQTASTEFRRLRVAGGKFSLLECLPHTGRQHQIRLHLAEAGHPIVGDKLYGLSEDDAWAFFERKHLTPEAEARLLMRRHALHSTALEFNHPVTGARMEVTSGLPRDMAEFLDRADQAGDPRY